MKPVRSGPSPNEAHTRHHDERHKERDAQQQITDKIEKQIGREQQDCKKPQRQWL